MRSLARLLGLESRDIKPSGTGPDADTHTVTRIAAELDRMEPDLARYLAAFAYVLARVAHADREISDDEQRAMQTIVKQASGLPSDQANLVVELAGASAIEFGATENYLVTRQFRELSTPEQRLAILRSLFAVAAADQSISSIENDQISQIGAELGLTREQITGVRGSFREHLEVLKGLPTPGRSQGE